MKRFSLKPLVNYFKKFRKHIAIIFVLLVIETFSRNIWSFYYSQIVRPRLLLNGAILCQNYEPILLEYEPMNCDIVMVLQNGEIVQEKYFTYLGKESVEIISENRNLINEISSDNSNIATVILPCIGFFLGFLSAIHKSIRTHELINIRLRKHPSDNFEQILNLYYWPLFLSFFLSH